MVTNWVLGPFPPENRRNSGADLMRKTILPLRSMWAKNFLEE
jgi:hypothetical protein